MRCSSISLEKKIIINRTDNYYLLKYYIAVHTPVENNIVFQPGKLFILFIIKFPNGVHNNITFRIMLFTVILLSSYFLQYLLFFKIFTRSFQRSVNY